MISKRNISSDAAAKAALKSELGITNLEENQTTGVEVYSTYAELPATGTLLVSYKVSNDPTSSLNGYYHWTGASYVKDADSDLYFVDSLLFSKFEKNYNFETNIKDSSTTYILTSNREFHESIKKIDLYGWTEGAIYKLWFFANNEVTHKDRIIIGQSLNNGLTWSNWIDSGIVTKTKTPGALTEFVIESGTKRVELLIDYDSLIDGKLYKPWQYTEWDNSTDGGENIPGLIIAKHCYKVVNDYSKSLIGYDIFRNEYDNTVKIKDSSAVFIDTTQREFHEAVLPIKLTGCNSDAIYKLNFMGVNHATYQDRIIVYESFDDGATWAIWLDTNIQSFARNANGWTPVEYSYGSKSFSLLIDYASLVEGKLYKPWQYTTWDNSADGGENIPGLIIARSRCEGLNSNFIINWDGTTLDVISSYSTGKIKLSFSRFGNNNLFDFSNIVKTISNVSTNLLTPSTDHFTAYQVLADENGDGDGSTDPNTGGNHAFNTTGTPTAAEQSVKVFVDGTNKSSYSGKANTIEIQIINNVQAQNTCKADGTGREVLEEINSVKISKDGRIKMEVSRQVKALEAITFNRMFLHSLFASNYGKFRFLSISEFDEKTIQTGLVKSSIEEKGVRIYSASGDNVLMKIQDIGLTGGRISDDRTFLTYQNSLKVYQCVVQKSAGLSLSANDVIEMFGGFEFWSEV